MLSPALPLLGHGKAFRKEWFFTTTPLRLHHRWPIKRSQVLSSAPHDPRSLQRRPLASERCRCSCRSSRTAVPPLHNHWSTWSLGTWPEWCSAAVAGGPSSQRIFSAQEGQSSVRTTICKWMMLPADFTDKPSVIPFTNKNPRNRSNVHLLHSLISW